MPLHTEIPARRSQRGMSTFRGHEGRHAALTPSERAPLEGVHPVLRVRTPSDFGRPTFAQAVNPLRRTRRTDVRTCPQSRAHAPSQADRERAAAAVALSALRAPSIPYGTVSRQRRPDSVPYGMLGRRGPGVLAKRAGGEITARRQAARPASDVNNGPTARPCPSPSRPTIRAPSVGSARLQSRAPGIPERSFT